MSFLTDRCTFAIYDSNLAKAGPMLDCGKKDLNEFFACDAFLQADELLCKNYCFVHDDTRQIVAAFTLSNDSIKKIPTSRKKRVEKNIAGAKHYFSYPAVMIGRLGVHKDLQGQHIGSEVLDFIKAWFLDSFNKAGCRFLLVDSYKTSKNLHFYETNGFEYIFSTEEQERIFRGFKEGKPLNTRLMYFDLKRLSFHYTLKEGV